MGATKLLEIAVPGGTVAVEQAGEGIPIILLHGWAVDRRIWTPQVEALADRFRLIALDRRGFGASTAPPGLAKEIGDLLAVLARLEIDRAVIVGMSQGGRVALRFAATHPKRVRGLVLQGAPLDGFAPGPRGEDAIPIHLYRALVREGHIARMKDMWRRHPLMRVADPAARSLLDAVLGDYDGRDLLRPGPDAVTSLADSLAEVAVHSLVVTGEQDIAWRQLAGDALAYGLPHARRARLAGADHLCNLTHPEGYNSLLALFVASTGEAEAQRQ
ncbi:MAG TPA: alpha/beta hydrolase [Allosphingosinicella sp.]|nr:alpha/beta hydrolase [Allosphingosinicella sp.]